MTKVIKERSIVEDLPTNVIITFPNGAKVIAGPGDYLEGVWTGEEVTWSGTVEEVK